MKFFQNIVQKFTGRPVDWDELEENLIRSDIGVPMTLRIMKRCRNARVTTTITANDIMEVAREEICAFCRSRRRRCARCRPNRR